MMMESTLCLFIKNLFRKSNIYWGSLGVPFYLYLRGEGYSTIIGWGVSYFMEKYFGGIF